MLLINLIAGAGAGKSTGRSYLFYRLKSLGMSIEEVTEFAKDKVWEKNVKVFQNQAYIFGKQYFRQTRLEGEVDMAITDSPLILSAFYGRYNEIPFYEEFSTYVTNVFKAQDNLNFFIERTKPYNPKGRNETREEAENIDLLIKDMLIQNSIPFIQVTGDEEGYNKILEYVLKYHE